MLKKIRVAVSIVLFSLLTLYFIDFAHVLPGEIAFLARIQLIPALLAKSFVILLALLLLTLLFGRFYCSSICPMGTFQDIFGWIAKKMAKKRKRYSFSKPWNVLRISVLALAVLLFILGYSVAFSFLDPYSAYGRMATNLLKPVYLAGNNLLESIFTSFGNYTFYSMEIYMLSVFSFVIATLTFLIIGFLAWRNGRTFCNTICPVGTTLGFIGKFSFFKIRIDEDACNSCGACIAKCKSSCIDTKNHTVDYSRCVDCFNCLGTCKQNALHFAPYKKAKIEKAATPCISKMDANKRRFLASTLATVSTAPVLLAQDAIDTVSGNKKYARKTPISPPGAIASEKLLHHCTACQLCISKCPSRVLKPAFMEYGIGGVMMPMMHFDKGFCNYGCSLCTGICPNGALTPMTRDEKIEVQMGYVVFNEEICVVKTNETNCGACSEHCPTQAVKMVSYKDGLTIPEVDVSICVGCGGCEYICPVEPYKAIHVEGNPMHKKAIKPHVEEYEEKELDSFGF